MALQNVTTVITNISPSVVAIDNFTYLAIILGGIIGTFLGMMIPYYKAKKKYGKEGIDLLFDKDFLKVAAFALATSIVGIGSLYPTLLAGADPSATYFASFLTATTTAFLINVGGTWMIGTNNKEAEDQLAVKRTQRIEAEGRLEEVRAKLNSKQNNGSVTEPNQ